MSTIQAATITPEVIADHGITPEEYERVKKALGREPTYTELGVFAVMWSEHCSYKSSRIHLKKLPTRGKLVVQGPGENAGIIDIGGGYVIAFKIESHNHPSFIEPLQGAATGVGGILRDIFTMGARPIAVMDSLRFGRLDDPATGARNRRILSGVVAGIAHYGNCFGVPTVGDECIFEPCYDGNPLVNVFALGVCRKQDVFYAKAAGVGNPVIYVGARTGRDGIHGASMASAEFTEESKQKRPNVQVGDPFMEKLLLEACLEAMKTGAIVGIQDMGAAGLTCSTCEMGSRGEVGIEIDLGKVPQRETGMTPYEIMLSESQERMLLVAERGRESEVLEVFKKWGLDAVVIGEVTDGELAVVKNHGAIAAEIPAHPLAEEGPVYHRSLAPPPQRVESEKDRFEFAREGKNLTENFKKLLASPEIASKHWITEQYDTSVRTNTLAGPGASDAAVVRIKESEKNGIMKALALATDGNGRWCQLNPKLGAMHAVAEAARNVATSGARPIAATNCLNFGSPEKPEVMWQFSQAIDGIASASTALGTPITGGNVSFYNETLGKSIYPTPIIGILGLLDDASRVLKIAFRAPGDAIVLLDGAGSSTRHSERSQESRFAREFSSSEYARAISTTVAGEPPAIDLAAERGLIDCLVALASHGIVVSAHDISDGGLAVTIAESCFATAQHIAPYLGATLTVKDDGPAESALFGERGARSIVSVAPETIAALQSVAAQYGVAADPIGQVTADGMLSIQYKGRVIIDAPVKALRDIWADSIETLVSGK